MKNKTIRFGIIGCGLMGREFASAVSRWCHLNADLPKPEIIGVCDKNNVGSQWFVDNFSTIKYRTNDYKDLIDKADIDAIYCAIPHNLHEEAYIDIIEAGKHLLGEKPFGIDKAANDRIMAAIERNPEVMVRCSSEFPYFPACQQLINWINEDMFGQIIEVRSSFRHSSDMDLDKPINWKRMVEFNGEYGCMGDLGLHTLHLPLRVGWTPKNVYAKLSKIVNERKNSEGKMVPCETWDNATLSCDVTHENGYSFPLWLETKRMAPGCTNDWSIEVYGLKNSARFTSSDPNAFYYTQNWDKEQAWCRIDVGYKTMIPTITGSIFEFGFTDAILQMWAAFIQELGGEKPKFGCITPEETHISHKLYTAALESQKTGKSIEL